MKAPLRVLKPADVATRVVYVMAANGERYAVVVYLDDTAHHLRAAEKKVKIRGNTMTEGERAELEALFADTGPWIETESLPMLINQLDYQNMQQRQISHGPETRPGSKEGKT